MRKFLKPWLHAVTPVAVLIAVIGFSASPAAAGGGFGDVDDRAYYGDAVTWMVDNGITTGIEAGCFGPGEPISRGQVAAFLYRLDDAVGNQPQVVTHPFDDVIFGYQQAPIGWMYGAGITTGTSAETFDPAAPLTRGDFATLLWRYAGRPAGPVHGFADVDFGYQSAAVGWMAAERITEGTTPTTFDPHATMTRAEAAAFLYRFVDPDEVATPPTEVECSRTLRAALITGGLTADEAACAAPWLTDFTVEYLTRVAADLEPASFELILAVAIINDEVCISEQRLGELSRVYL